jgi:glycosyltransferase involved in cell wall biosynthesis
MSVLARENEVLYIEPRPYLRPTVKGLISGELSWRGLGTPRVAHMRDGLHVFHPPLYAPLSGREPLRTGFDLLRRASVRRAMRRLRMTVPIVWLFRPDMADVAGRYGERLLIYHIVDDYLGYADYDVERAEEIRRREQALIARADLVLVTSRALLDSKGGINPNTHWVPNAVDYERFSKAVEEGREPEQVADLCRPRVGYVGAINEKIDIALLSDLAQALPQAAIILVGPVRSNSEAMERNIKTLRERSNVHFVGRVPVEEVPCFMNACDVGLLPYRRNAWTQHIHPLKLYEYLACGLPIVSTDIPAAHEEEGFVCIASPAGFAAAVSEALSNDSEDLRARRRQRAAQNTWIDRVERISTLIERTLGD